MKTIVITGGTDGMGRRLALDHLRHGDRVIVIGSSHDKGRRFLADAEAEQAGQTEGFHPAVFIRADLSLVAENRRVIDEISTQFPVIDALVLGARYYRSTRHETTEGFEHNFALFYLSRYLLSHGFATSLAAAERPVIIDLAGPGNALSTVNWDDLQFIRDYVPDRVMAQCGKLSDLLGLGFAATHPHTRIRYVIVHPGLTATGFTGEYNAADAQLVAGMRERGQPVEAAVALLHRHLVDPDPEPLSAYMQHTKIQVNGPEFDPQAAQRLKDHTRQLLADS